MDYIALYNPFADNGNGEQNAKTLTSLYPQDNFELVDASKLTDYNDFFKSVPQNARVIICGGDGTLNRFINDAADAQIPQDLLYFPCGSGNDFAREVKGDDKLIPMDKYLKNLPTVTVKGRNYKFINGVGYGIDGYCCEEGDRIREANPKKKINYTSIAIKGLLFKYKPANAVVTVDGTEYRFKKVWCAPIMHGKYYGGGMMPTPAQERNSESGEISVMIFYGSSKIKTLCIFPSIFKGEHVKSYKHIKVLSGKSITVKFDEPRPLQIDGETIKGVTECTAISGKTVGDSNANPIFENDSAKNSSGEKSENLAEKAS